MKGLHIAPHSPSHAACTMRVVFISSIYLSIYRYIYLSIYLSICLSIYLSIYLSSASIYLLISIAIHRAPTQRSAARPGAWRRARAYGIINVSLLLLLMLFALFLILLLLLLFRSPRSQRDTARHTVPRARAANPQSSHICLICGNQTKRCLRSARQLLFGSSGMWCLRMWCLIIIVPWPHIR